MAWRMGILIKEDALAWLVWGITGPRVGVGFCKALEPEWAPRTQCHLLCTVQSELDTILTEIHTISETWAD